MKHMAEALMHSSKSAPLPSMAAAPRTCWTTRAASHTAMAAGAYPTRAAYAAARIAPRASAGADTAGAAASTTGPAGCRTRSGTPARGGGDDAVAR